MTGHDDLPPRPDDGAADPPPAADRSTGAAAAPGPDEAGPSTAGTGTPTNTEADVTTDPSSNTRATVGTGPSTGTGTGTGTGTTVGTTVGAGATTRTDSDTTTGTGTGTATGPTTGTGPTTHAQATAPQVTPAQATAPQVTPTQATATAVTPAQTTPTAGTTPVQTTATAGGAATVAGVTARAGTSAAAGGSTSTAAVRPAAGAGAAARTGVAAVPGHGGGGVAAGYRARRTLPFRVEAVRQLRRRRTLVAFAVVGLLPVVVWAALTIGGQPRERRGGPSFIDVATSSGLNFALAVVFISSGFLLTVPVALFFGDTVASEAGWSSLRYLLAAPVPRTRLLVSKASVSFVLSLAAVPALPAVALAVGTAAYGWGGVELPVGGGLPAGTAAVRFAGAVAYVFVGQLAVAGLAFWLSTVTDAPLGAVGGAVGAAIVSNILDAITALGSARQLLPTHWQFAWVDLLQPGPAQWSGVLKGTSVAVSFAVVFAALAVRHFRAKDIVS